MKTMTRVVLGGGISGLSAAHYLSKLQPNYPVTLIEASNRLGGWIKTNKINDNLIFEEGPRTIRPGGLGVNTLSLIEELGIEDQIVPISSWHPAARNRMIYAKGRLHSLPSNLSGLFKIQQPFSRPLILFLMRDWYAEKKIVKDESIYDFINRRFGSELADYLISPLICGICAGDAKEISVNFLMKSLFKYEQEYGSITRGLVKDLFKFPKKKELHNLALKANTEKWQIYSFKNGIETLPNALEKEIKNNKVNVYLNTKCNKIEFIHDGINLYFEGGKCLSAYHLFSSIPAENLGFLVRHQHPNLTKLLCEIKTVSVGVINLCYRGNLIKNPGFGFLVPPKEKIPILGITYDSCIFPRSDDTVLTVMMGGKWFSQLFGDQPCEKLLLEMAKEQVQNILGISGEPTHFKVNILRNCIPQYVVGHNSRIREIEKYITTNRLRISLCGASYHGVGINDTITSAKNTVSNFLKINND